MKMLLYFNLVLVVVFCSACNLPSSPTTTPATAPIIPTVSYTGGFGTVSNTYGTVYQDSNFTIGTYTNRVGFFVPTNVSANPALIVAMVGTGEEPYSIIEQDSLRFRALSVSHPNFILIAPDVAAKNVPGNANDPDHFDPNVTYGTSWNLYDDNPETNRDLLLIRAAIDSAIKVFHIDPKRIYFVGHSNGGFFSYFAAMALHNQVAAYVASSGGATFGSYNRGSTSFIAADTSHVTVASLQAESLFPAWAKTSTSGTLRPITPPSSGWFPHGFLYHGIADPIVPVVFTCILSEALQTNATTRLQNYNHMVPNGQNGIFDFASQAWTDLSPYQLP